MPAVFVKGNKLGKGRPKGVKNSPEVMSIRILLERAFLLNQSLAIQTVNDMFKDKADFKFLMTLKASLEPKQINGNFNVTHSVEHLLDTVAQAERQALVNQN